LWDVSAGSGQGPSAAKCSGDQGAPSVARLALMREPRFLFLPLEPLPYNSEGKLAGESVMTELSGWRMDEVVLDFFLKRSVYR
jgi:hypothetical protein